MYIVTINFILIVIGVTVAQNSSLTNNETKVIINDIVLNQTQIIELKKLYGVEPKPGRYWYDAKSGLYGRIGNLTSGILFPNHTFGSLNPHASAGDTQIFLNGRELPQAEYIILTRLLGSQIVPGSYWLDHLGNAGYEGSSTPIVNLYTPVKNTNTYQNNKRTGDNFWRTRFSAGNSNADNSQGYVNASDYGVVVYGF